jgi:dihydroorotase
MNDTLTITRPDDWHIHFRDGAAMQSVLPDTARVFGRAIPCPTRAAGGERGRSAYRAAAGRCAGGVEHDDASSLTIRPEEIAAREKAALFTRHYPAGRRIRFRCHRLVNHPAIAAMEEADAVAAR